jgi:hypothetical protein
MRTFFSLLVEPSFSDTHKFKQFGLLSLALGSGMQLPRLLKAQVTENFSGSVVAMMCLWQSMIFLA